MRYKKLRSGRNCAARSGVSRRIVLASASPRRRELLALIGLQFEVDPGNYEEEMGLRLKPRDLARHLSRQKALSVAARHCDTLIIAADTFIAFRGRLLGKPKTKTEACRMLRLLSGRRHSVITGFTLMDTATGRSISRSVETRVCFRSLTAGEIGAYVATGEPMDKAGAYAIQGLGSLFVKGIEGDYFNVIGLPLCAVVEGLKRFGIRVLSDKI